MRDPNRIKPFLAELYSYWIQHPDLRFGQLVSNIMSRRDPFYIEDEDFLAELRKGV